MAYSENKTIDGLDALTSLDDTDVLVAGDQSDSDRAKKITKANFEADLALTASQVSDFDTEVAGNSAVTANTAKVTNATHTGDVTGDEALTIGAGKVTEAMQVLADNTTNDVSSSKHGYAPKGDGTTTKFLNANGAYSVPAGSGGTPEGTAVLSTGETVGKVLQADGDNSCSWVTLGGGGDALVANPLSQFAATTSAQLAGVISNETGTGLLVFGTSPNITTPTGIVKGDVGLGNVDNTSDTTKNAAAVALTNKTGFNGLALTENADGFEIEGGSSSSRTLSVSGNDIDLVGSGSNTYTFPASTGTLELQSDNKDTVTLNFVIDGGGDAITTGIKGDVQVDFAGTIEQVTLLADQSGSIVVDIWKDTYANFPATDADTITASAVPTISSAVKAQDSTLTGWTTSITAGDHLRFNVDSITTCERVTVALEIKKSA